MIGKLGWSDVREEETFTLIEPWKFGVFSEEITDLEIQPAFVHSYHIDYDNACQRLIRAGMARQDRGISRWSIRRSNRRFPNLVTRMIISSTSGENLARQCHRLGQSELCCASELQGRG